AAAGGGGAVDARDEDGGAGVFARQPGEGAAGAQADGGAGDRGGAAPGGAGRNEPGGASRGGAGEGGESGVVRGVTRVTPETRAAFSDRCVCGSRCADRRFRAVSASARTGPRRSPQRS